MGHRGPREQDAVSPIVVRRPTASGHGPVIWGVPEIAAPLEKSRLRGSTALGFGGHVEKYAHAGAPSAGTRMSAGWRSGPYAIVPAIVAGCSVASNSVGLRYESAECSRWRL